MTTLKIDDEVRDRLRVLAQRHGRTMGEEVEALVKHAEEADMWKTYRTAIASLKPETRSLIDAHSELVLREATDRHGRAGTW